jgi:hypothetical protein
VQESITPIEWWPIWTFQVANPICDMCSNELLEFPAAVLNGSRALCQKCRLNWHIKFGDDEFFESAKYSVGDEPPEPGVNFGGRKKQ